MQRVAVSTELVKVQSVSEGLRPKWDIIIYRKAQDAHGRGIPD